MKLVEEQVKQFGENGFLIVDNLLDADEVATLLDHAEWIASGKAPHIPKKLLQVVSDVVKGTVGPKTSVDSLRKMSHLAFYDKVFEVHAHSFKTLTIIESLVGPDLKLYQD